ncbi:MAG TPA: XylR family transcriptional regulator, partial [Pirellulales bacterium]
MLKPKRVLLLIESSRAYGRGCLLGIAEYMRAKASWRVLHLERGVAESLPAFIQNWKGDGILCRLENDETAAAVQSLRLPAVDLRGVYRLPGGAVFDTDPATVAKLAAEHFVERGFRNFAFCGFRRIGFSEQRSAALMSYLAERGFKPSIYVSSSRRGKMRADAPAEEMYGEVHVQQLIPWLKSLP